MEKGIEEIVMWVWKGDGKGDLVMVMRGSDGDERDEVSKMLYRKEGWEENRKRERE